MGIEIPWIWFWVILAAVLVVGEIFTAGFFLLPFAVGAMVAALFAGIGLTVAWQWAGFVAVSVITLLLLKRFADRVTRDAAPLNVAADRVIGRVGVVLDQVNPHGITGRVRLGTEEWRAESDSEESIAEGAAVEVLRIDGTHLVVRPRAAGQSEGR